MKICKSCLADIRMAGFQPNIYYMPEVVEENDCELPKHKELNRILESFERHAVIPEATFD